MSDQAPNKMLLIVFGVLLLIFVVLGLLGYIW